MHQFVRVIFFLAIAIGWLPSALGQKSSETTTQIISDALAVRLQSAGESRASLVEAIAKAEEEQRPLLEFLIAYLPDGDLERVKTEQLVETTSLALKVRSHTEWQKNIPDEIFMNNVLPYANMDETRDPWRADFYERFWPLVKEAKSTTEAAQILNEKIFGILNVKYSTGRRRANQSPKESIEQGLASCSGLSIILVNACRSVGVPARLVGIPKWANKNGNHTWVEIWDGDWHFTGAAEYNAAGLDQAWFNADAALADSKSEMNSIYAVSYRPTGTHFPLVWDWGNHSIHAENVTNRYARSQTKTDDSQIRCLVRVWDQTKTKRIAVKLAVWPAVDAASIAETTSRDEAFDTNDIAEFTLKRNESYLLAVEWPNGRREFPFRSAGDDQQMIDLQMPMDRVAPTDHGPLTAEQTELLASFAKSYFAAKSEDRSAVGSSPELDRILLEFPIQTREIVWAQYKQSTWAEAFRADLEKNQVTFEEHVSPFVIRDVGTRPAGGWPLVIAMHGGGNAPQELNDSQWRIMQKYYKDHAEVSGYRYLALRAPNNSWNGFYADYVYPLIENLIAAQVLLNDVDPNKVFIMGYSHGGYGAFAIGPKIPYRFAAIHASAAAPTDGETSAKTLRTTRFTFMVGEKDTAYGRRERCEVFDQQLKKLRSDRIDIYPAEFFYEPGYGHGGLPDRDMLTRMLPYKREPIPSEVTWSPTDPVVKEFFWLGVSEPAKGMELDANIISPDRIKLTTENVPSCYLMLDERLVAVDGTLTIERNGTEQTVESKPSLALLCKSLTERHDINLAYSIRIELESETE